MIEYLKSRNNSFSQNDNPSFKKNEVKTNLDHSSNIQIYRDSFKLDSQSSELN